MPLADIRSAIQAAMQQVAAIGVVTDYEPLATRKEEFERYFKASTLAYVLGWTITRESTDERDATTEQNWSDHLIVIRGYRPIGTAGATEKDFQDLIEAVRVRLRTEQRDQLGGAATFVGPPKVRIAEPRDFAGYLVHYCEITLRCGEAVSIT